MRTDPHRVATVRSRDAQPGPVSVSRLALFFALHVLLAFGMRHVNAIGTMHAVCTAMVGIWWAMRGRDLERLAYMGAYIAGAEVMWRMSYAEVFWEFGKYSMCAMLLMALLRLGRLKGARPAFFYFLLLLPSSFQTIMGLEIGLARRQISFNLSGPLTLAIAVWFFSNVKLSKEQVNRVVLAFMGPIAGVAGNAISGTLSAAMIQFNTNSNFTTSGGFGPNQVSAVLGLAAFLAFFYLLYNKTSPGMKVLLLMSLMAFAAQSAMTFSRGGLYAAAASAALSGIFLVREKKGTARLLQLAPVLFVVAVYIIVPQLVQFTGGAISERFAKTNLTRRGDLMEGDIRIWQDNPVFGVGPGMGAELRGRPGEHIAAHTEFTRLLSEHGLLGLLALGVLIVIGVRTFLQAKGAGGKAFAASLMLWSILFMFANGMRLAAPSFMFGLACVTVVADRRAVARVRRVSRSPHLSLDEPWKDAGPPVPAI